MKKHTSLVRLGICALWMVFVSSCSNIGSNSSSQQTSPVNSSQANESPQTTAASTNQTVAPVFTDPNRVCKALSAQGLTPRTSDVTGKIWGKTEEEDNYYCSSDDLEITAANYQYVGDVPNTITYHSKSEVANQVQMIQLDADIFNAQNAKPVIAKFKLLTLELFDELGLKIPKGLEAAIEREQPKMFQGDYGTIQLVKEKYKLGHGLKLMIKEASYLRSVVVRKESSKNNFEKCREVIAKLRRYPASDVEGDGDPINKGSNLSFMFKGRSKDLFFCEVTPSGDYEITAAIGGEFPFKQIGTGKFK